MARRWLSANSKISLMSAQSKEIFLSGSQIGADMASVCYRYFRSKNIPNSCGGQEQDLFLEFSHEDELPYSKEKVRQFWQVLDKTVCVVDSDTSTKKCKSGRRKRRAKPFPMSILSNPVPSSDTQSRTSSSSSTKEESLDVDTDPPALAMLKTLMDRGVDVAALAIRSNYPLEPRFCTCDQPCCLCILFSSQWENAQAHLERMRQRLYDQGKLKPGQDPFPVNARLTVTI